jgi:hypothetical protein
MRGPARRRLGRIWTWHSSFQAELTVKSSAPVLFVGLGRFELYAL